jgi:hypothetical protein
MKLGAVARSGARFSATFPARFQITVAGQATDEYLEWLDVRPGEIFCVMAVS